MNEGRCTLKLTLKTLPLTFSSVLAAKGGVDSSVSILQSTSPISAMQLGDDDECLNKIFYILSKDPKNNVLKLS